VAAAAAAQNQRLLGERGGLHIKGWTVIQGRSSPGLSTEPIFADAGMVGDISFIYLGDPHDGHTIGSSVNGVKCLGSPLGSPAFQNAFVDERNNMHKKRLNALISLGAVDAQVAKLLLIHCALPRLVFLTQTTPLATAADAFERGHASILDAWMKIVDVSDVKMNVHFVRDRVTLPLGFGGQGISNNCEIADSALAANWQYTSAYLASRVPALARIAAPSEDGTAPMNDMIEPVWNRVRARGAEGDNRRERDILPDFADSAAAPCTAKGLQHLLSQMYYARKFEQVKASAVSLSDDHSADPHAREFAAQVAVTMNSLRGEGATAWHTVIPFSKAGELSTAHVRNQVRLELGLIPAAIKILVDRKLACHHAECDHATFTHNAVHHILNHKEGNAGGNRVRSSAPTTAWCGPSHSCVKRSASPPRRKASGDSSLPTPGEADATTARKPSTSASWDLTPR